MGKFRAKKRIRPSGKKRVSAWKQMMHLGKSLYQNYKGPLGYAIKGVNMMKNLINTEKKFLTTLLYNNATITSSTASSAQPIAIMAQGTTDITRVGNSILCKGVKFVGVVTANATSLFNMLRIVVFIDKQNANGTAPTNADIWSGGPAHSNLVNINNADRFVIIRNMTFNVNTAGTATLPIEFYVDLTRLHSKYDLGTATQGALAENHVYVLASSNDATNGPSLTFSSNLSFYDN